VAEVDPKSLTDVIDLLAEEVGEALSSVAGRGGNVTLTTEH